MEKFNFRKLLSPEQQKQLAEWDEYYEKRLIEYRNIETKNLIASVKYFMTQMREPRKHFDKDYPATTYDSTFWYILLPEMIRRLDEKPSFTQKI